MLTKRFFHWRVIGSSSTLALLASLSAPAWSGTVDLAPAPLDVTASVDPNLVVSFDDSGSMAWNAQGDLPPGSPSTGWNGPWMCAGVIDPGVTDKANPRSRVMNGVYYNPNITYRPASFSDGTAFPDADATLKSVWQDGINANEPGHGTPTAAEWANNPDTPKEANDLGRTNLMGTDPPGNTDNRWKCGLGGNHNYNKVNPFASGGPYYYKYKASAPNFIKADGSIDTSILYKESNWEAVAVPTDQYQNFANWYAYYRTRSLSARSALSRVFGAMGANVRVAWQTIWPKANDRPWATSIAKNTSIITSLTDTNTTGNSAANNWRTNFFNFIYNVGVYNGTPDREATVRASEFFSGGQGVMGLTNPFYQPGSNTVPGKELSCRQNFHVLVTDGYWNGTDSNVTPAPTVVPNKAIPGGLPLDPEGKPQPFEYSPTDAETRVYWDTRGGDEKLSLANIGFHYWAKDLRPDLANNVGRYIGDKSTNLDGTGELAVGQDPLKNKVIFFNPANDPANWQHVVQFMIALGIDGTLRFPEDYSELRKSGGTKFWPMPVRDKPSAVDDMWHAAINSRGSYFSASNPNQLVERLTEIINNILSRRSSSTAVSATLSISAPTTQGYSGGYDSSDWSGYLLRVGFDPTSGAVSSTRKWDAACLLTGGLCPETNSNVGAPHDPNARNIITSTGGASSGIPFRWAQLNAAQRAALGKDPATGLADAAGEARLNYLRGSRVQENTDPLMRKRTSVMGAVINSRPRYLAAGETDLEDMLWPAGSPELAAAEAGQRLSDFHKVADKRLPTVYVGSNQGGMLHALDASTGKELWAYMPNTSLLNGRATKSTQRNLTTLIPGVDDTAITADAFVSTPMTGGSKAWRTVLVQSMRMGGRGVFALDVTDPVSTGEGDAKSRVLWEINGDSEEFKYLGYTYASANTARIKYQNKWVVVISSGYFPKDVQDPLSNSDGAKRNQSTLYVVDMETGSKIAEIHTTPGVVSYGLSTPAVASSGSNELSEKDQLDDYAVAGDLAGNLWRFDFSDADPSKWSAQLMFSTYSYPSSGGVGKMPITTLPILMADPQADRTKRVWVFGTGKYLGDEDRYTAGVSTQAFFGIRETWFDVKDPPSSPSGVNAPKFPVVPSEIVDQKLTSSAGDRLVLTSEPVPKEKRGWRIPLDVRPGERVVVNAVRLEGLQKALLTTLLPKGDDPCNPGRSGSVIVVDPSTGGAGATSPILIGDKPSPLDGHVGYFIADDKAGNAIPTSGTPTLMDHIGGGNLFIPGFPKDQLIADDPLTPDVDESAISFPSEPWHRGSWRSLLGED
ncbi:pilus assembly protein [Tahibacter amnicola]|uniref:PilC/PilY family type IV pilus protein n=1 Tax=Tahibacter amnicola TaxID=2976241 RepID=A0ABY6BFP2_9GAMM|nr:PilC/PilY family type IV pilus protein [Tahibacter amnicola]UXI67180.1 PilC/PilY family type IV pilus protein [Tahibacter amnicola]